MPERAGASRLAPPVRATAGRMEGIAAFPSRPGTTQNLPDVEAAQVPMQRGHQGREEGVACRMTAFRALGALLLNLPGRPHHVVLLCASKLRGELPGILAQSRDPSVRYQLSPRGTCRHRLHIPSHVTFLPKTWALGTI